MPRQPYERCTPGQHYTINHEILHTRPHHMALIARCVQAWAQVEAALSNVLASLLGSRSEAAIAVYLSLQNSRAQRSALESAAKIALPGADLELCQAILTLHQSLSKQRNDVVHGVFGVLTHDTDGLIWVESEKLAYFHAKVLNKALNDTLGPDPHEDLRAHLFVYRSRDLQELLEDIIQLWHATTQFNSYLTPLDTLPKADMRRQLCGIPRIQAELNRVRLSKTRSEPL